MKKRKIAVAAAAVVLCGLIGMRFLQKEPVSNYETRPTVRVENPERRDIVLYTDLTGLIEPQSRAVVMPKMAGEVLEVYFQAGDTVTAGQALCRIDSDALTALKLQTEAAAVALDNATNTANRTAALYSEGFVSQEQMEQAQSALKSARISYESAKNQYDLQVEYTTVTAPIDGVIESRGVEPHDHISTSTEVCTISGASQLQVTFGITEKIHRNMETGDTVTLEKNGVTYEGTVTEIGTMVNASGLYDVRAVTADAGGLTTGMRVKLTVVMDEADQALSVPVDAVSYDDGVPFVYCYADGIAVKTDIEAGIYDSEWLEVLSGLDESSRVITSWSNELVDQAEVLVAGEDAAGQAGADAAAQAGSDADGPAGADAAAQAGEGAAPETDGAGEDR